MARPSNGSAARNQGPAVVSLFPRPLPFFNMRAGGREKGRGLGTRLAVDSSSVGGRRVCRPIWIALNAIVTRACEKRLCRRG